MGVSSYLEFVTVLFGWVMYGKLWDVLNGTGIVYLPFLFIFLNNIIESRKGGDDEGSAAIQSLKKCETDVVVAMVVLFLAAVPFTDVRLGEMSYVRPQLDCAVERAITAGREPGEVDGGSTPEYTAALATLSGETGRIPLWWGMVHVLSKAVVAATVAGIPCSPEVASLSTRLGDDGIEDADLLHELADFQVDCHQPALTCLSRFCRPGTNRNAAQPSKDYVGSEYFLNQAGYYDRFQSRKPLAGWPTQSPRDDGLTPAGAYPTCKQWWETGSTGLRARLLLAIDADLRNELIYDPQATMRAQYPGESAAELEDRLLRRYLNTRNVMSTGGLSYDPSVGETFRQHENVVLGLLEAGVDVADDVLTALMAGAGMLGKAPAAAAEGAVIRQGLPIFLSLLLMVFVIVLPVLMVFSRYDPGILLTLTLVFFGLQFVYVLWGVAFYVDQQMYEALVQRSGAPTVNALQAGMMVWVQRLLYVAFPMIWLAALGWVGVKASEAFTAGVNQPSQSVGAAARSGGDAAAGVAKAAVTKGMK